MLFKKISLIIVLTLFFTAAVPAAGLEKVSLQLKWKHAFQFAGFYVATEKGFYSQVGLEVDIREVSAHTDVTLAALFQHSPLALMTLKSSGIVQPEDLVGKKVMMFANKKTASLTSMLASRHVDVSKFTLIPHSFDINDLILRKIDAYEVYTSDQPHQLELKGIEYNLINPRNYGFDFYGDILFTSQHEITKYPERSKAFYEASLKGWEYAFEHIDETVQLIMDKYNNQDLFPQHLKFEANVLKKLSGISEGILGQISQIKIDSIANVYRLLGLIPGQYSINNFIYQEGNTYLTPAEKSFIENHEIQIITTDKWAPFNIRDQNQQLTGIAIDYWNLIRKKTGLKSTYQTADAWLDVIEGIKNKSSDITISTSITEDRKQYAIFSKPYASFPIAIATKNDKGFISSPADLEGRKLAVGKGYSAHKILKARFPKINFVPVDSVAMALQYVSEGKVFAAAEILPVLAFKIGELGYSNIKISGTSETNFDVRIMVRDDLPQLVSIINKGISAISNQEQKAIFNKWVAVKYDKKQDYTLLWKIIVPLFILLILIYLWNRVLKREINRRISAEKKLTVLATTDPLTSVPNRYRMEELLEQQQLVYQRHNRPFSIIFVDLDDFKNINDQFGHETGDTALVEFSYLVQKHIRKIDFFGRWGGEEFLALFPETRLMQASQLAEKIRLLISNHKFTDINHLSISIGVAEIKEGDTPRTLLGRADKGLYRAKELGKNRVEIIED